ncbi:hypothetical protein ACFYZE_32465 [Streptomyces sp. NPDC001796]|uniref:hypothetical protein n=1 Tax=Streptomyces sp. NPDC001796 TaxID=3364609 RepID=UPI00368131B3
MAASDRWWDEDDGRRPPGGEVHAWEPGANQTLCGRSLHRSRLATFRGVDWLDILPETGGDADAVRRVRPRCASVAGRRDVDAGRGWRRTNPRP